MLDADPYPELFHLHHGATHEGLVPSGTLPGRSIPRPSFDLRRG